jgi:hypothetical protein
MPAKRLMGIAFRLSIVVGIIMVGVSLYDMHNRYNEAVRPWIRIHLALRCAQGHSDQTLLQYLNQFGNIDISKVYCADKVFWATLAQIRGEPADFNPDLMVNYRHYVYPEMAAAAGVMSMVGVIVLGVLLILFRRIANWVIGTERA